MIKFINSWAQGIILAVIIVTIIEIILPEGKNKKYVKTVIGVYILFTIIYPLINKFTKTNINTLIENTTKQMSTYQENNSLKIDTDKCREAQALPHHTDIANYACPDSVGSEHIKDQYQQDPHSTVICFQEISCPYCRNPDQNGK